MFLPAPADRRSFPPPLCCKMTGQKGGVIHQRIHGADWIGQQVMLPCRKKDRERCEGRHDLEKSEQGRSRESDHRCCCFCCCYCRRRRVVVVVIVIVVVVKVWKSLL
jgi:hypothetical protein